MTWKDIEIEWMKELLKEKENYIKKLEKENKKLKSDLAFKNTMLDNVKAEYGSLQKFNKKQNEELQRYKDMRDSWEE